MATKSQEILLKGNTTNASAVPSSLKVREIAINALDRSLFTNDGNSIVKLYTGTAKWFDVNGNANNALKLGGILASEYINKEAFNSHINNSTIHITAAERTAWNKKWDYNEEIIKAVKVNAALNADYATSAGNADKLDGYYKDEILRKTINPASVTSLNDVVATGIDFTSWDYSGSANINNQPNGDGAASAASVVSFGTEYPFQIYSDYNNTSYLYYRSYYSATGWKAWRRFAFIDSNVASATKLQDNTAFAVWGQTFFENGKPKNVSGDLKDVGNITASGKATIQGDIISGGEVAAIVGDGTPAGVTDYSALTGKPSINGVTLVSGNNTLAALGIQAAGDYATNSGVTTLLANYADKTFVSNNYVGKSAFNNHTADTDIHITAAERVDWNAKWDYNEATIKAVKVTSASSADSVAWTGISGKPSTFTPSAHTHTASEVSGLPTSLKNPYALTFGSKTYDGSAAATITASDLGALTAHQSIYAFTLQVNGTSKGVYNPASAAKTINIAVPTKTSDITNDSGFITSAAIPTALKNPYAVEIKANGVSLGTYDGSAAAIFNLSAANVGAASKVHTHTASEVSGLPTNLSAFTNDVGYITGITKSMVEGVLTGDITSHTHTFDSLTSKPTTIAGYGITDALTTSNYNSYVPTLTGTGASGTWGIDISGNASSATKLQTARTFWEKPFDGTGNISGGITTCDYIQNNDQTGGFFVGSRIDGLGDKAGGLLLYVYGQRKMSFYTNSKNRMEISTNGNILIGTTTDNGYKLQVDGSERVYGDLIVDGEVSALVA